MSDCCVYMHLTPDTKQVFYVGIGSKQRAHSLYKNHRNRYWNAIVAKHGIPSVIVIAEGLTGEDAAKSERFWIRHHGLDRLANISPGGDNLYGMTHSEESKRLIGLAHKGKIVSNETREKLSKTMKTIKKKPFSEEHRRNIAKKKIGENNPQYDKTIYTFIHSEHGKISCTQYELRNRYGLCDVGLRSLIKGRNKSCKGWRLK